ANFPVAPLRNILRNEAWSTLAGRFNQKHTSSPRMAVIFSLYALTRIYYFEYIKRHGIGIRDHCGAKPPRDIESAGLVGAVGGRNRASTSDAAADCVQAPASPARGRVRGIHGGRTAPSLPAEA